MENGRYDRHHESTQKFLIIFNFYLFDVAMSVAIRTLNPSSERTVQKVTQREKSPEPSASRRSSTSKIKKQNLLTLLKA
jgi:hypothetical protein